MASVYVENLVRYRRMMNERHRKVAAAGFTKLTHWVRDLNVKRLTASEGIRLFEVFVRIEQMASWCQHCGFVDCRLHRSEYGTGF